MTLPPSPIDAALDAAVRHLGCEGDLGNEALAGAVEIFLAQLHRVRETATSAHDFITAAARYATTDLGPVAAAWIGYAGAIRGLDAEYQATSDRIVAEAERIARGKE